MRSPIRFGVVGCGSIGTRHLNVIHANPRARVAAICDTDPVALARASRFGAQAFSCLEDMLRQELDVVSICTPHALHAEMAIATARAGRHVLVEKPMALTSSDADRMIEAAGQCGVRLMVVKQNRHNVPVKLTKAVLDGGDLGRVYMVQCHVLWNRHGGYYADSPWRGRIETEGGALFTQASHFIDLMVWWFGDIVRASCTLGTLKHPIEIEDCGSASVVFDSGVIGTIVWTTSVAHRNYEGSLTIVGDRGTIKIGGQYLNVVEHWEVEGRPIPPDTHFGDKPNSYGLYQGTSSNHDKVVEVLVDDLLEGRRASVEGYEGRRSVRAIELMYQHAHWVEAAHAR